jgi:hypothetical protein
VSQKGKYIEFQFRCDRPLTFKMEEFMKKYGILVLGALLINGCASTTNNSVNVPVEKEVLDYVVRERNPDPAPDWIKDFSKWKRDNEGKGYSYFLGESGDVNDRISGCEIAGLSAKKKISQQIAELISNKIAADKQGRLAIDPTDSNDPGLKRGFESLIAGKSIAFLSGVREYGNFWELRDYSKSNGHKRVFNCSTIVMISEKDLQTALVRSSQRAPDVIEDSDAKAAVKESLKDIDAQFKAYSNKQSKEN